MARSKDFLAVFDIARVEQYFFGNYESIAAFFKVTSEHLGEDLDKLAMAFNSHDLLGLRNGAHTIKPIFGIIGLPLVEREVDNFYTLCKQALTTKEVALVYDSLWRVLQETNDYIITQNLIFEQAGMHPIEQMAS